MQLPLRFEADLFLSCSREAGEWLFGRRICESSKFYILKNAINIEEYVYNSEIRRSYRKMLEIDNKFVIGHVGRFTEPKNHKFVLDIFEEIHKQNDKAILLLVGYGELYEKMQVVVEEKKLQDCVKFLGNRNDVPALMQAMDCFLFPSLFEGLGIVIIEAQAAGLPVICSEAIPREAYLTDLITVKDLNESRLEWANEVLRYEKMNWIRENKKNDIIKAGYDIKETTEWIERLYLKHLMGKE